MTTFVSLLNAITSEEPAQGNSLLILVGLNFRTRKQTKINWNLKKIHSHIETKIDSRDLFKEYIEWLIILSTSISKKKDKRKRELTFNNF